VVEGSRSVAAFFRECLKRSLATHRIETSELAESYLVGLMTDLSDPKKDPVGPGRLTLVEMVAHADASEGRARARLLREIGDSALLWSGIFRERMLHKGLKLSYYVSIGGGAYEQAGHLNKALQRRPFDELCLELGAKFRTLSNALDEAAALGVTPGPAGLVSLIGRAHRRGRPWMNRLLRDFGFDPKALPS